MSGPAGLAIATGVLLDAALKSTAVLGAGLLLSRGLRHASHRHALHAVTLAALPLSLVAAGLRGPEVAWDVPALPVVWLLGAAAVLLPLATGLWRLRRLPFTPSDPVNGVPVGTSPDIDGPLTWGGWRPRVLLPEADWAPAQREAALAHELAHVRRHDWLVHVLAWVVCAVFWFHPLVWATWRRLAIDAELAADDDALAHGVPPSQLAAVLLAVATRRAPRASLGAASSTTARRIRAVLDARPRRTHRWPAVALSGAALVVSLPLLAAWHPWTAAPEALTCKPDPYQGPLP